MTAMFGTPLPSQARIKVSFTNLSHPIPTGHTIGGNLSYWITNFQTAVNLWFDNQAEANATYGHISD